MSNELKNETSPYLLQHADNPVNWHPWGREAFDKAGKEDKPVFLSIGYSTCHWCHVMAHESFEDREIADILNKHFISIKVDKEERPDIDSIYMAVCQAFTGSGGWPTSIMMTADQKPFFAGTYFPKTARYGSVGLKELLLIIHEKWHQDRETLLQMYSGGLFDHIGYGFCRYSTDRFYLVPHFEKMLYDNALLILAYCKAYEITQKPLYREIAEKTAFYILTEMTSGEGSFYSAQDADSDGEEGKYYVFEPDEIIGLLGGKDGSAFNEYYDITTAGNFEGKNIPNLLRSKAFTASFEHFIPKIREYRRTRNRLHTDDKILTSWNSLMIAALCTLYRVSRQAEYLEAAKKAQQFIEKHLCAKDTLYVSFRDGKHSNKGFLEDYASYTFALLALYDATLDMKFLDRGEKMAEKAVIDFYDKKQGGFYLYGKENETLIFRPKECYDGAIPSGNSLMAYNLVRLSALRASDEAEVILENQLNFMVGEAERYPTGYAMFLFALSDFVEAPPVITVVKKDADLSADLPFAAPTASVIKVLDGPTKEYRLLNDAITFYVCRKHSCLPPVNQSDLCKILSE